MNNNLLNNKKKAFTLIELLIVIAIIGILFIVLVSKVDFATDKAKATGVQTDFRSFQVALDTVAKENAGFNTFGYNTGDNAGAIPDGYAFESTEAENKTKGDGIRNSYDQGDKNLNGKQDVNGVDGYTGTTEVFTGRKIYTETWTEVYTLTKPGTTGLDATAVFALESAINANLDPKLHITINAADGKITMANQARDPWKNEYHGVYISQAERDNGADRGAIIIYSNGANGKWGSAHDITNGVVTVTVPGNNTYGKDDYSIVSCYTFTNGYGEVLNMSTGFSNNQSFNGNTTNAPAAVPGGNAGNNGGGNIVPPADPNYPPASEGLEYTLKPDGTYEVYWIGECTDTDLVIPETYNGKPVTSIGEQSLCEIWTTTVTSITIPNSVTSIGDYALAYNSSLTSFVVSESNPVYKTVDGVIYSKDGTKLIAYPTGNANASFTIPNGVTTIEDDAFYCCRNLTSITLPNSVTTIGSSAFSGCYISSITIPGSVTTIEEYALDCNLTSVTFDGTMEQWHAINKEKNWSYGNYTIYFLHEDATDKTIDNGLQFTLKKDGTYELSGAVEQTTANIVIPAEVEGIAVTSIGIQAFDGYNSLTSLTVPASVTRIGINAFRNCRNLANITFEGKISQWYSMELGYHWSYNVYNYTLDFPNAVKTSVWEFNDVITVPDESKDYFIGLIGETSWCGETIYYRISFYSGYVSLGDVEEGGDSTLYYNGWYGSKTVTFLEEITDPELLAWLTANATQVE